MGHLKVEVAGGGSFVFRSLVPRSTLYPPTLGRVGRGHFCSTQSGKHEKRTCNILKWRGIAKSLSDLVILEGKPGFPQNRKYKYEKGGDSGGTKSLWPGLIENWERNVRLRHSCDTRAKTTWRKAQVKRWRAKQQTKSRLKLFQWKENEREGKLKIWILLRHQGDLVSRRQKPRNWWYSISM